MNAPNNKFPYNRRIPRHKRKRQPKPAALKNPYLQLAKPDSVIPADAGTKPKNPNRSVAARKAITTRRRPHNQTTIIPSRPSRVRSTRPERPDLGKNNATSCSHSLTTNKSPSDPATAQGRLSPPPFATLWWLMSYDNAIVITTAPSERQVKELLWREIRQLYMPHRETIGGKLTRTRLDFAPNRYAYGFSTNTEDRFQGFHSGNILVIVDEASGVDEFIYYAITGILTTQNAKLLMIGNPHGLAGTFYDAFHKGRKEFHTVHISAFDTPAFTDAGITADNIADFEYPDPQIQDTVEETTDEQHPAPPTIPYGLSTPNWALRTFNQYGPQSSVYQTRVLGEFPEEANDTLIPLRDVEAAVRRPHVVQPDDKPIMGVDIARFGDDKTVIIIRQGMLVLHIEELRKSDLVNTTGRVITAAKDFKVKDIIVDEVGIGAGVLDTLKVDNQFQTTGFNGGARADHVDKYLNLRAQIFDGLKQRFADGDISIPTIPN